MKNDDRTPMLGDIAFPTHPGGQPLLELAAKHERPDLLFLSHHLGCDQALIEQQAARLAVAIPETNDFYLELSAMVRRAKEQYRHHERRYEWYCLLVTLTLPLAWFGFAVGGSYVAALTFSMLLISYAFVIFHTRHHRGGRVYSDQRLNLFFIPVYDFLDAVFMIKPSAWRVQHQSSHHVFPNDPDKDHDVYHPNPWLRLHSDQPLRPWHRFQTFYVPILLILNGFSFPLTNITSRGGKLRDGVIYLLLTVAIPLLFHGVMGILLFMLALAPASLLISYLFQVSHNFSEHEAHNTAENPTFEVWVKTQVRNSTDYGGYLMTLFFGGINLQASHHVAPALSPLLLYYLSPELEKLMNKKGIEFYRQQHLLEALVSYHKRLYQLSA